MAESGKGGTNDILISMPDTALGSSPENLRYRASMSSARSPSFKEIASAEPDSPSTTILSYKESKNSGKWTFSACLELVVCFCSVGCLIASIKVKVLESYKLWGFNLWRWCVLLLVFFSGRLLTRWIMNITVSAVSYMFERRGMLWYFIHGVRKSFRFMVWLGLMLVAWVLLFDCAVNKSEKTTRILDYVTKTLGSCLLGAFIWLLKSVLVKFVASYFQSREFFDQVEEAIFHQYVIKVLSRPPSRGKGCCTPKTSSFFRKLKEERTSPWTFKGLSVSVEDAPPDMEITAAAHNVFRKVAKTHMNCITEEDFHSYFDESEVDMIFPMFNGSENGNIAFSDLKKWMVDVYHKREVLISSINDSKRAIRVLNRFLTALALMLIIVLWSIRMEIINQQAVMVILSQILLGGFIFGKALKNLFEAMIFVFVVHPFDVGDRCVIDGVQMVVEGMDILTTVFLRDNNKKIYYPNSVLARKPITNFCRSPDMIDTVEFSIDGSTPAEKIKTIDQKIKHMSPGQATNNDREKGKQVEGSRKPTLSSPQGFHGTDVDDETSTPAAWGTFTPTQPSLQTPIVPMQSQSFLPPSVWSTGSRSASASAGTAQGFFPSIFQQPSFQTSLFQNATFQHPGFQQPSFPQSAFSTTFQHQPYQQPFPQPFQQSSQQASLFSPANQFFGIDPRYVAPSTSPIQMRATGAHDDHQIHLGDEDDDHGTRDEHRNGNDD